ncbi:MAG: hypothetical protein GY940_16325 [bacterium]|nr:hypothetical protein [bacterium]
MSGFRNKPKILRGAFVEYGKSEPPLVVVFQFNPIELSRNRSISFSPPNESVGGSGAGAEEGNSSGGTNLRDFHKKNSLEEVWKNQQVTVEEETISFDIRLDATGKMNDGDSVASKLGVSPELSALEMMVHPKDESILDEMLGESEGHSFTRGANPPMILFIWGIKRVMPVNITSMNIKETEFSTSLSPVRAEVSVSLTVIEGSSDAYKYTKVLKEAMSALNRTNRDNITNISIPG